MKEEPILWITPKGDLRQNLSFRNKEKDTVFEGIRLSLQKVSETDKKPVKKLVIEKQISFFLLDLLIKRRRKIASGLGKKGEREKRKDDERDLRRRENVCVEEKQVKGQKDYARRKILAALRVV